MHLLTSVNMVKQLYYSKLHLPKLYIDPYYVVHNVIGALLTMSCVQAAVFV